MTETKSEVTWTKPIPATDGWYWIKYPDDAGKLVKCPCLVLHLGIGISVTTAHNDSFSDKTRKIFGFNDAEFGPEIPIPEN